MNPWEVLGIAPTASKAEISDAYRILVQIFHPDRFAGGPEKIKEEAKRRMQELNEAYKRACNGEPIPKDSWQNSKSPGAASRPVSKPRPAPGAAKTAFMSWEAAAKYRATQAARHRESKEAEEKSLPNGMAVARSRSPGYRPSMLLGLGLARTTNKLHCRGCNSIQWLPSGWRESLEVADFHCSFCDRRILAR